MPAWLSDFLVAIGGGTVVLIGILTIFKKLFLKLFESGMDASFEKHLEKYRNQLSRSTMAYEILLKKELDYYEALDPYFATLVPLVHDLVWCSDMSEKMEPEFRKTQYAENLRIFLEMIPKIKNDSILHQVYAPAEIANEVSHLIGTMQRDLAFWNHVADVIFGESNEPIDIGKADKIKLSILHYVASIETAIRERLADLSQQ